ncbi:MAG TPA: universal stress protein, partial [Ktedonobacteraceae bacterium]|nr:universal stress protein [Ktedonobacteraceae bacterium]
AHRLVHQTPVPVLVLRDTGDVLARPKGMLPFRIFVPLDGSQLAETALVPAANLAAALAAPHRGSLHLGQVAKLSTTAVAGSFVNQFNENALEYDRRYLTKVAEQLQTTMKSLKLSISWSIASETNDEDVAATLREMAEYGERGKEIEGEGGGDGDLIAISTHGRGGLERWVMGSVTERLLNTTKLPMLIVPPQKVKQQA